MVVRLSDFPLSPSGSSGDGEDALFSADPTSRWSLEDAEDIDVYASAAARARERASPSEEPAARHGSDAAEISPHPSLQGSGEFAAFIAWVGKIAGSIAASVFNAGKFLAVSIVSYARVHPVHCAANVMFIATITLLLATGFKVNEELITQRLSGRTVSDLIAASQYTRAYSLGELENRKEREFLRVGAPEWVQREAIKAILSASREAGLSLEHQAVLLATAEVESGFNPMANAATTTACGVFQFIRTTGKSFGLEASDCLSPSLSATAAIAHYMRNYKKRIEERVASVKGPEKMFRMFELSYYLHHDGASSADPSDELKATVLAGTPFLFKAYEILQREENQRQQQPTFMDNLEVQVDNVVAALKSTRVRFLSPFSGDEVVDDGASDDGEAYDGASDDGGGGTAEPSGVPVG